MPNPGPLAGIRVIDFGRFIAGPYCGMLLADMGADVIRVDRRQGSEDRYVAPITKSGEGGGFLSLNRNKRSLTLDTSKPQSAEIIRRLVRGADVVIANLPIDVLKKMGLDYDSLRAIRPDIIFARISTFGPDGPYASRVGFDTVAQAMSGALSLTGFPGPPVRTIVPFADYGTALHTAFGIMVALRHRDQTGEGQIVDGSLLATGITFTQGLLAEKHVLGVDRQQAGNASFYAAPADTYQTQTGWLATRSTAAAISALEAARIPSGPVLKLQQVLDDPQVKARELLRYVEYPGAAKPVPLADTAVRLSATPGAITRRAPLLGEHTSQVLLEVGYSPDEITVL